MVRKQGQFDNILKFTVLEEMADTMAFFDKTEALVHFYNTGIECEDFTTKLMQGQFVKGIVERQIFHHGPTALAHVAFAQIEGPVGAAMDRVNIVKAHQADGAALMLENEIGAIVSLQGGLNPAGMFARCDDPVVIHVFADIFLIAPIQHHLLVIAGQGAQGEIDICVI